jgi:hypothetical protein
MLSTDLALRLKEAGLTWRPASGDRFFLPFRDMDDDVFVISEMTVDVHRFPSGTVIGFNGVTEWALDAVSQQDAVWIPAENQLRDLLGGLFHRLERQPDGEFVVALRGEDGVERYAESRHPADAYGYALLDVLEEVAKGV